MTANVPALPAARVPSDELVAVAMGGILDRAYLDRPCERIVVRRAGARRADPPVDHAQCARHGGEWDEARGWCSRAVFVAEAFAAVASAGPAIPKAAYVQMCNEADREMLRAEAAEAEVKRLSITPDHLDEMLGIDPNDPLSKFAREIVRLRVRLGRMTRIAHRRGHEYAEDLRSAALSSSEPVTAGERNRFDAALTVADARGVRVQYEDDDEPAGEVTPPAEQRARHHHSRKAMECVHNGGDCCVECCELGAAHPAPAPTTEGGQ